MEFLKNYGIVVTSIELNDDGSENPVITHISWGDNLEQALRYMKSHLITDYFLAATFAGSMILRDNRIRLTFQGKIISIFAISNRSGITQDIFNKLTEEVNRVLAIQHELGLPELINDISKSK